MESEIQNILRVISNSRFPLHNEKELQLAIENLFTEKGIQFDREHRLDDKNIPDFFISGIAIEIKIKGSAKAIYKQCVRYCAFTDVQSLILVTNKSMGFPEDINRKPCYVINLGKAWL